MGRLGFGEVKGNEMCSMHPDSPGVWRNGSLEPQVRLSDVGLRSRSIHRSLNFCYDLHRL